MNRIQIILWIGIYILALITFMEMLFPQIINNTLEGFENAITVGIGNEYWAKWVPRRGDVGLDPQQEEDGYIRDSRYFNGYTDVQRLGEKQDYCRMIIPSRNKISASASEPSMFFACALGGTEGLSTTKYRTKTIRNGFQVSRDDYMNNMGDGREGYCRILKVNKNTFQAKCNEALDNGFSEKMTLDNNPPESVQELLQFYEGIIMWLRLRDDIVDYAGNLSAIMKAGNINIDEYPPLPSVIQEREQEQQNSTSRTLEFNGIDQYLRIGDNKNLEFGNTIDIRYMRGICFWVYFDEFTNNAHIFDFGNGAGKDNVFVGIIGRGDSLTSTNSDSFSSWKGASASTSPSGEDFASASFLTTSEEEEDAERDVKGNTLHGQQCVEVTSPQRLMKTTQANVNDFDCPKQEIFGKIMPQLQPKAKTTNDISRTATLVYEVWDHKQRKLHIQVNKAIPINKWVHITITTRNSDATRPYIDIYKNGELIASELGWLPQNSFTTHNYIGKSNWMSVTTPYANADELFKGKLFDFRAYNTPIATTKLQAIYKWGKYFL